MTCPDPANNRACVSLYNVECILPEVRKYCDLRSISRRKKNSTGNHVVDANKMMDGKR